MVTSNELDTVRNILTETLFSYNYNETTVRKLLTDNFISGLLELQKQEPENNKLISMLKHFNNEQTLISIKELDTELRKELSCDSYVNRVLNYFNSSWMNISFDQNIINTINLNKNEDVDNTKVGVSILAGVLNFISRKANTGQKIVASDIKVPLEVARRLHNQFEKELIFADEYENKLREVALGTRGAFTTAHNQSSPLIIDLDGDGVETQKENSSVHFDHDGNGFAESSGWVGKDDGLLVRDINGNGQIDNGTELFGNNSVLSSGQKAA